MLGAPPPLYVGWASAFPEVSVCLEHMPLVLWTSHPYSCPSLTPSVMVNFMCQLGTTTEPRHVVRHICSYHEGIFLKMRLAFKSVDIE